ncbi:hypothetical protein SEUCBS139899_004359 [Sporothrix eucalyptigena]|uniref:NB-ARC domain-containing protein n=1 Tax=Sporothrix eucalyptigena TaxID=1812306 RepID=A0ABP0CUF8_9PEZI
MFYREYSDLDDEGRYYRFNVSRGLGQIAIEEARRQDQVTAATRLYIEAQGTFRQVKSCAKSLTGRNVNVCEDHVAMKILNSKYKVSFDLKGVPICQKFVPRPNDMDFIEKSLLPTPVTDDTDDIGRKVCILHGLGGMGKTQLGVAFVRKHKEEFTAIFWLEGRSKDTLMRSLAGCAKRIPEGQIPSTSRTADLSNESAIEEAVRHVRAWLERPDNTDWLLVFDNVDKDHLAENPDEDAYDVLDYVPGDHGSVLITTRLETLQELGDALGLRKVDDELSKAMFEKWYGKPLGEYA